MAVNCYCWNQLSMSSSLEKEDTVSQREDVADDVDNYQLLYLAGENTKKSYACEKFTLILTNARLFVIKSESFICLPITLIDCAELREFTALVISCKDGRCYRIDFELPEVCCEWWQRLTEIAVKTISLLDVFAFTHSQYACETENKTLLAANGDCYSDYYVDELKRLKFDTETIWRTTEINSKFGVCSSYPKLHLVPAWVTDTELEMVGNFRAMRRFPSIVWRHVGNGAVLVRSSQPEIGWLGWRCKEDETLLRSIAEAAMLDSQSSASKMTVSVANIESIPRKFLVVDARSYTAAVANRAKGGGCEFQEYYDNCDIKFMGLANIHGVRKSFQSLKNLISLGQEPSNWLSSLEHTKWLHHISSLLRSALVVVNSIEYDSCSVLVHCSDGWDRTSQIVALAELLLDPFYRTLKGFEVLIQREWIEFGHKFSDRCGIASPCDPNERSPVFLQWLDSVHQLIRQFPIAFEFNEGLLLKLVRHVHSGIFGTFLCNRAKERCDNDVAEETLSLWSWFDLNKESFVNHLYVKSSVVLRPSYQMRCLVFWESAYLPKWYPLCAWHCGRTQESAYLTTPCIDDQSERSCSGNNSNDDNDSCKPFCVDGGFDADSNPNVDASDVVKKVTSSTEKTKSDVVCHRRSRSSGQIHSSNLKRRNSASEVADTLKGMSLDETSKKDTWKPFVFIEQVSLCLDSDGLIKTCDPVQERILEIKYEHKREVDKLQRRIEQERAARNPTGSLSKPSWSDEDALSLHDSLPEEGTSLSSASNEEGWEQVQYDDVQPTRWVPDHVASNCEQCGSQFNLVIRKHHCRRCGRVFCSACSDQSIPLPNEQLYEPVRVCKLCYECPTLA